MTKLALYFAPGSSSMAVHIALHEVGAPFEARPMSFYKHEMRTPEFRAINPAGKVPTLMIDGRPITEVAESLWWSERGVHHAILRRRDVWITIETDLPSGDLRRLADTLTPYRARPGAAATPAGQH